METSMFALLIFSVLGGTSAGIAVVYFATQLGEKNKEGEKNSEFVLYLVALVLLGIGLLASLLHLGQPFRFLNGLYNPTSMISQESYWSIGLGVLLIVCVILAKLKGEVPLVIKGLAAFAGCGLLIVSALAYALPMGIPGWNDGSTIPILVIANLILGAASIALLYRHEAVRVKLMPAFVTLGIALSVTSIGYMVNLMSLGLDSLLVPLSVAMLVGAICPAIIAAYKSTTKTLNPSLIMLIAVSSIIGLVAARVIFYSAGIHL